MSTGEVHEQRGLIRRFARWVVRRYYPRIEITGADRIPQTGPVLLCANHANSLIDPLLIGIAARRPVRFMAKAPLFKHPLLGPPMSTLGMVPSFQGSDDAREVHRHLESLGAGAKVLLDDHSMGSFQEGKSTEQAHLEMVRVGEPIEVEGVLAEHEGDVRNARRAFTSELESRLKEVVVHLDELESEPWLDDLEILLPAPAGMEKTPARYGNANASRTS